jgi:hypothetical protein
MLFVPLVCLLRFFVVVVDLSWAVRENFALCSREDSTAQLEFFPFCFSRAFYYFLASLAASLPLLFSSETSAPICSSQFPLCRLNFLLFQLIEFFINRVVEGRNMINDYLRRRSCIVSVRRS